jgi:hypothetical protein
MDNFMKFRPPSNKNLIITFWMESLLSASSIREVLFNRVGVSHLVCNKSVGDTKENSVTSKCKL